MTLLEINQELLSCRRCSRLVNWRELIAHQKRRAYFDCEYWGKPVPGFGDPRAQVFVIGLAPGAHGSNRTGRQFTGDSSGDFLYPALYRAGFASQPFSISRDDGMRLIDLYTAPVCRCVPPQNKPTTEEMINCQPYLEAEFAILKPKIYVVLGKIAFSRVISMVTAKTDSIQFNHGVVYPLTSKSWLVCSYHPSRQNTQTGRLTVGMFDQVWKTVRELVDK